MLTQYSDIKTMQMEESVVSSRVRLARNIFGFPFPGRMSQEQKTKLLEEIQMQIKEGDFIKAAGKLTWIDLSIADKRTKSLLLEKHLISPHLFALPKNRAVMTGLEERISVMVNEEDHLRIQGFSSGYDLEGAYVIAKNVDQAFEKVVEYAFDTKKGYLTSCPTNLGTGLRASVMLFLPALAVDKQMAEESERLSCEGYTLRGFYGEGSKSQGAIFQLSNQVTLGVGEEELLTQLGNTVAKLIEIDWKLMDEWSPSERFARENHIWKSYGLARYAKGLNLIEAVEIASDLRLARRMGLDLPLNENIGDFNKIVYQIQTAHISSDAEEDRKERLMRRALLVRENLLANE